MKEIKAVVFDYGKVISFPPADGVMDEIAALAGLKWELLEPLYRKFRGEYDRGKLTASGFYRLILEQLEVSIDEKNLKKMGELDIDSWKRINLETVKLMEEVKKAGRVATTLSLGLIDEPALRFCPDLSRR